MTEPRPEHFVAARLLVQWGRTRQAAWHDPSRDLLAALGDRHAWLNGFSEPRTDGPLPDHSATPSPGIADEPHAPTASGATPLPSSSPSVAPASIKATPAVVASVRVSPRTDSLWIPPRTETTTGTLPVALTSRKRRLGPVVAALAAAVVLGAVAVPSVWCAYQSGRAPVAPQPRRVAIDSKPPGSIVVVDAIERGKTPLVIELPPGVHRVELRYRRNVRAFDLEVVAGMPAEATVD